MFKLNKVKKAPSGHGGSGDREAHGIDGAPRRPLGEAARAKAILVARGPA
jgi:hypothetical protein